MTEVKLHQDVYMEMFQEYTRVDTVYLNLEDPESISKFLEVLFIYDKDTDSYESLADIICSKLKESKKLRKGDK